MCLPPPDRVPTRGAAGGNTSTIIYFMCEDCASEYGFIALVTDTKNNMIGLHSMR